MAINFKDLTKLTKFARKNGITSIKVDGLEVEFHAAALFPDQNKDTETLGADSAAVFQPQYSDEEILNWSSASHIPPEVNN